MLVSLLLSLKLTVSLPVVHRSFTGTVPLNSGRGLKILHADHIISWPPHIQYASAAYVPLSLPSPTAPKLLILPT